MSLSAVSSPRATEPKIATDVPLWRATIVLISLRCVSTSTRSGADASSLTLERRRDVDLSPGASCAPCRAPAGGAPCSRRPLRCDVGRDHDLRVRRMFFINSTRWSGSVGDGSNSGMRWR